MEKISVFKFEQYEVELHRMFVFISANVDYLCYKSKCLKRYHKLNDDQKINKNGHSAKSIHIYLKIAPLRINWSQLTKRALRGQKVICFTLRAYTARIALKYNFTSL